MRRGRTSQLEQLEGSLKILRMTVDSLIYASVILGGILLVQIYGLVPPGLFYSVLIGWLLYLIVAIGASVGRELAYHSAMALSFLTLLVSIPRPEHYSLASDGLTVGALTFIAGSAIQVGVIVAGGTFILMKRKRSLGGAVFRSERMSSLNSENS